MADLYQYLPGFQINYKDGGLVVPNQGVTTDSILIIGTAADGPKGEPVQVYRPEDAELIFGKPYDVLTAQSNGTSLVLGMLEAFNAGCRDIRLVRIGGEIASLVLKDLTAGTPLDAIKLTAKYAGDLYNGVKVTFDAATTKLTIAKPGLKGGKSIEIAVDENTTFASLVTAINDHEENDVVDAEVMTTVGIVGTQKVIDALGLADVDAAPLVGGENGTDLTNLEMYHELHHTYELLENTDADCISVLGVYADDDLVFGTGETAYTANFAEQLANFCARVTEKNQEIFGVIACKPIVTVTQKAIKEKIAALKARSNKNRYHKVEYAHADHETGTGEFLHTRIKDVETGANVPVGHLICVLAMPEAAFAHSVIGRYYAPATAAFAGFVSSLRPESAPTNKILPNARGLRYKLSPSQLNDLGEFNYVTLRDRASGVAITDGCTSSTPVLNGQASDYARLSTLRITFAAVNVVRAAAEPFIGEPNEAPQRNALNTAIRSGLDGMKKAGALNGFNFNISATLQQRILGESYINLELVPALENRKIRVSVALRATL